VFLWEWDRVSLTLYYLWVRTVLFLSATGQAQVKKRGIFAASRTPESGRPDPLDLVDEELDRNASDPRVSNRIGNLEDTRLLVRDEDYGREVELRHDPS
jgi:hypothetical protein